LPILRLEPIGYLLWSNPPFLGLPEKSADLEICVTHLKTFCKLRISFGLVRAYFVKSLNGRISSSDSPAADSRPARALGAESFPSSLRSRWQAPEVGAVEETEEPKGVSPNWTVLPKSSVSTSFFRY